MEAALPDRFRRVFRGVGRRVRDRLALHGYVSLVHGPLRDLVERVDDLQADAAEASRARLDLQDQLSVGATRVETLLDEVRGLRDQLDGESTAPAWLHEALADAGADGLVVCAGPDGMPLLPDGYEVAWRRVVDGVVVTAGRRRA